MNGVGADNAAAQNHHLGWIHAWHTAKQHAQATVGLLKAVGTRLDRHAASDFGHRRQQRQPAVRRGHRLVGNTSGTTFYEILRLIWVRREV